jgi:hypothetical protein
MKAFQVTIASMMGLVLIVALLQVALWKADAFWAAATVSFAVGALSLFLLDAIVSPSGRRRAARLGACVLGGG